MDWVKAQELQNCTVKLVHETGKTPVILVIVEPNIPSTTDAAQSSLPTCLFYGHFDKQPPFTNWREDLGPYKPVIQEFQGEPWLFGRGGVDDGYSIFMAITCIKILQQQQKNHGRVVMLMEGCEESGSLDLPYYMHSLKSDMGNVTCVICLDSAAGNYQKLWLTTSLRGSITFDLKVSLMKNGSHSGRSGVVADSFRVLRTLLSRIENQETGEILIPEAYPKIPAYILAEAEKIAKSEGESLFEGYNLQDNTTRVSDDLVELLLNRGWRPTLTVVGADGFPPLSMAGNVLRPYSTLRMSMRLPPMVDSNLVAAKLKTVLETNPPYNAKVECDISSATFGWSAPNLSPWLFDAVHTSSKLWFNGNEALCIHSGGGLPLMNMLEECFPKAKFIVTGLLGPNNNAHSSNEGMNIPYAKQITKCMTCILAEHAKHEK